MDIKRAMARDLTDSLGASQLLSYRFGKEYSIHSLHQLVQQNKLRSFLFKNGELAERVPNENTRGKDLIFLKADLYELPPPNRPGRPVQAKANEQ